LISYTWRTVFGPEEERELREMLAEAAEQDAEAGFPAVSLDQAYPDDASHLVVRLLPDGRTGHDASASVAAYLRVEPDPGGGPATARYVVRPSLRSRGISTLLLETLGLDLRAEGGWAGTGVSALRVWARGDHPAAQRMARRFGRFGVRPGRRQWQLLAPLRGSGWPEPQSPRPRPEPQSPRPRPEPQSPRPRPVPPADTAELAAVAALWHRQAGQGDFPRDADVLIAGPDVMGAVWYDPDAGEPTEYGSAGRIVVVLAEPGREDIRADLVAAAMTGLRDRGLRVAAITVDAEDHALTRNCRLLGFRHDRTDIEYIIGDASAAARPAGTGLAHAAAKP
jgi:mycothiol synthase